MLTSSTNAMTAARAAIRAASARTTGGLFVLARSDGVTASERQGGRSYVFRGYAARLLSATAYDAAVVNCPGNSQVQPVPVDDLTPEKSRRAHHAVDQVPDGAAEHEAQGVGHHDVGRPPRRADDVHHHAHGQDGVGRVDVICPGFAADCLETLEEIAIEGRKTFLDAGGKEFHYIPTTNDLGPWMTAISILAIENLHGWVERAA